MTTKLKYAGLKVGDKVRAYDFEPREDIRDRYAEGVITEVNERGTSVAPWGHYIVSVEEDTLYNGHWSPRGALAEFADYKRAVILVPFETTFDFEGRVVKL